METQAVDVFTPNWISNSTTVSIPAPSATYAGRLMLHREESTNTNNAASTARHRDENLLKKTSLKYTRAATQKTHPYRTGCTTLCDRNTTNQKLAKTAISTEVDSGAPDGGFDTILGCNGNTNGRFGVYQLESESSREMLQPMWMRQEEPQATPNQHDKAFIGDNIEHARASEEKRKKKTQAWRKQVYGLRNNDGDNEGKFAPIWMKRALSKSDADHNEARQETCTQRGGTIHTSKNLGCRSDASSQEASIMSHASILSQASNLPVTQPTTEVQTEENERGERRNVSVDVDSVPSETKTTIHIGKEYDTCFQSDAIDSSLVIGTTDTRFQSKALQDIYLDDFILRVLMTAVVSVLVEDVVQGSLGEVENEIISVLDLETFERPYGDSAAYTGDASQHVESRSEIIDLCDDQLPAAMKLLNLLQGEYSFQSASCQDQSCLEDNNHDTSGSVCELMTSESPPWAYEENVLHEESLINAFLQHDALEHGYSASVAVMDGGEGDGLMADVRLLWISDEDSFESGNSSLSEGGGGGVDREENDGADDGNAEARLEKPNT